MPLEMKEMLRQAVQDGGLATRIQSEPFIYIDKNYVRMFGGIANAVRTARSLGRDVVVQVRGDFAPIQEEALEAARLGASTVMVDTGQKRDLKDVLESLEREGLRAKVKVAFAGNVSLADLPELALSGTDIVDMGYAILDAPSLPMRFDVIEVRTPAGAVYWSEQAVCLSSNPTAGNCFAFRILEKRELWVSPLTLIEADLTVCAHAVSEVLGLSADDVVVTDASEDHLTFDILSPTIDPEALIGREAALLAALGAVPGVELKRETRIHSSGILGLVSLDQAEGKRVLEVSRAMGAEIRKNLKRRAIVFSTGKELVAGNIKDTNTPFLVEKLQAAGYRVVRGPALHDEVGSIHRAVMRALEDGYGLIVTTGGIGAESKDQTLEALTRVDSEAAMPYILKFSQREVRHAKDGVRIGVGKAFETTIVCLPGPHDEVRLAVKPLLRGLKEGWDKETLAQAIASVLRTKFIRHTRVEG